VSEHTATAGRLAVFLDGHDDDDLASVRIATPTATLEREPGTDSVTIQTRMEGAPGKRNEITAALTDAAGNTVENDTDAYVRKYDMMNDRRYDIGAHFIPQVGAMIEGGCVGDREITGWTPQDPVPPETVSYWTDQLTGHGVGRLIYSYEGFEGSPERLRTFVDSGLFDQVRIEPEISWNTFRHAMERGQDWSVKLDNTVSLFRETVMAADSLASYNGKPLVRMGAAHAFSYDEPRQIIEDGWGGYEEFFDAIRSRLAVNGTEPFLVGGMTVVTNFNVPRIRTVAQQFDALSNWFPPVNDHAGETYQWEEAFTDLRAGMENLHGFASDHGMDYVPTAMAGMDDRGNQCWGPDGKRHIPISTEWFGEVLELAETHATTGMIDLATVNDIAEGHELVASRHGDTDYGTSRLKVVERFQRGEAA